MCKSCEKKTVYCKNSNTLQQTIDENHPLMEKLSLSLLQDNNCYVGVAYVGVSLLNTNLPNTNLYRAG